MKELLARPTSQRQRYALAPEEHRSRPWAVHRLASDFTLLDVWQIPLGARPDRGESFADFMALVKSLREPLGHPVVDALFRLRFLLGRVFRWDTEARRPIPGTDELSVAERLEPPGTAGEALPFMGGEFHIVYQHQDEALLEVSNATIHALLHFGWVGDDTGTHAVQFAVYVKSRGLGSDLYMLAIRPFRHAIVYPVFIDLLSQRWHRRGG